MPKTFSIWVSSAMAKNDVQVRQKNFNCSQKEVLWEIHCKTKGSKTKRKRKERGKERKEERERRRRENEKLKKKHKTRGKVKEVQMKKN